MIWVWIFLAVVAFILAVAAEIKKGNKQIDDLTKTFKGLGGGQYFSLGTAHLVGLSDDRTHLIILKALPSNIDRTKIALKKITSVDVVVNSKTITSTKSKSRVGPALVGGLIAGPVGAIAGAAVPRKSTSVSKTVTESVILKLTTLNIDQPVISVKVSTQAEAETWCARLAPLIG